MNVCESVRERKGRKKGAAPGKETHRTQSNYFLFPPLPLNAGNCNSCWTFAATSTITGVFTANKGLNAEGATANNESTTTPLFSQMQLLLCPVAGKFNYGNNKNVCGTDGGGETSKVFTAMTKKGKNAEKGNDAKGPRGLASEEMFSCESTLSLFDPSISLDSSTLRVYSYEVYISHPCRPTRPHNANRQPGLCKPRLEEEEHDHQDAKYCLQYNARLRDQPEQRGQQRSRRAVAWMERRQRRGRVVCPRP